MILEMGIGVKKVHCMVTYEEGAISPLFDIFEIFGIQGI